MLLAWKYFASSSVMLAIRAWNTRLRHVTTHLAAIAALTSNARTAAGPGLLPPLRWLRGAEFCPGVPFPIAMVGKIWGKFAAVERTQKEERMAFYKLYFDAYISSLGWYVFMSAFSYISPRVDRHALFSCLLLSVRHTDRTQIEQGPAVCGFGLPTMHKSGHLAFAQEEVLFRP